MHYSYTLRVHAVCHSRCFFYKNEISAEKIFAALICRNALVGKKPSIDLRNVPKERFSASFGGALLLDRVGIL